MAPADLGFVDLVLVSHKHSDHFDPETIAGVLAASERPRLVVGAALVDHAKSLGIVPGRIVAVEVGASIELAGHRIRPLPSAHESLDLDELGRHLYLGFVVEASGFRFYHSGDSLVYPGLVDNLGTEPFDVLFLPINGRDPGRGVPGNMNAKEALALAQEVRPRFVVAHHYNMFTFNTVPVDEFIEAGRGLPEGVQARVPACGDLWVVEPRFGQEHRMSIK